jgi:DNA-binding response OmpR family regulator
MEFLSRVKAVLRRTGARSSQNDSRELLSSGRLVLDNERRTVVYGQTSLELTFKEFHCSSF